MERDIEWATPNELVKIFRGLSLGTLANLRSACRGPKYSKFGKKVMYRLSDIRRFLEDNTIKTIDQKD